MYGIFWSHELFCTKGRGKHITPRRVVRAVRALLYGRFACQHSRKVALASLSLTYNRHAGQLIFPDSMLLSKFQKVRLVLLH